ncbi:thioesterase family protein [Brevibacterium sp. 'Marine']|uniref:thioesterase family protein n=1 Tax=Brevibacterium sp. 'Marine' TaxID=2725563 RepID=UPI00145EC374|nr:thioesterase family protein [Brevibacterium sp. 'Marine']
MHFARIVLRLLLSRRRPSITKWENSSLPLRVLPTEIDINFHVNNGMYLMMMDLGRFDALVRSGIWRTIRARRWTGVISDETISFRKSLKLGQRYSVESKIVGLDDRAVYFEHRIVSQGDVYARGIVATRLLTQHRASVPLQDLVGVFGDPPEGLELPEWIHEWRGHNAK